MSRLALRIFVLATAIFAPPFLAICEIVTPTGDVTISITSPVDGSLWVGTASHGLLRLGTTGHTFSYSTLTGQIPCDCIEALAFDSDGRLWIRDGEGCLFQKVQ